MKQVIWIGLIIALTASATLYINANFSSIAVTQHRKRNQLPRSISSENITKRYPEQLTSFKTTSNLSLKPATPTINNVNKSDYMTKGYPVKMTSRKSASLPPTTSTVKNSNKVSQAPPNNMNNTLYDLLHGYQKEIENIRRDIKLAEIKLQKQPNKWELLDGYDTEIFDKIKKYPKVHPILMHASLEAIRGILPVNNYYNYMGSQTACSIIEQNNYKGPQLLNKTCVTRIEKLHKAAPVNEAQLSVGVPFHKIKGIHTPISVPSKSGEVLLHFAFIIEDAIVLSHGVVLTSGLALQPERCKPGRGPQTPENQTSLPTYDEVFSLTENTGTMFYHLTSEDLPRISPYLNYLKINTHIKVHIKRKKFHDEMLNLLGITSDRLIDGDVRAKIVYMPAGTACGRPGVFTTQLLSTLFHSHLPNDMLKMKQDTLILIKRSSKGRQFRNHGAILKMLEKVAAERGMRAVEYRDDPTPSLQQTMELFYRAALVLAPHGAGLSNLVFSRPGVVVMESFCIINLCFRNLMVNAGHIHHGYVNEDFRCLDSTAENYISDIKAHLAILGWKAT